MKKGFTLIEILIVISVVMVIMVSISGVMSSIFTSRSKNTAIDKITQNGNWILEELKRNVLNANSDSENGNKFNCPIGVFGNSITITNIKDGYKTTIACFDSGTDGYKIASISGKAVGTTVYLFQKNDDLFLNDCSTFVTCSTLPSLQLSSVNFNFNLGAGVPGLSSDTNKRFSMDVILRN